MRFATVVIRLAGVVLALWLLVPPTIAAGDKIDKKAASQAKLAQSLYLEQQFGRALTAIEAALKEEPRYVVAHQIRGQILFSMDAVEQSLDAFEKALSLDNGYTEARVWKASALIQLERYDEARKEYETALKDLSYPTPEKIHLNLGMLDRLLDDDESAIESINMAVRLNPSYAKGFYELGLTYEKMGKTKEALRAFQGALVEAGESAGFNLSLGQALMRMGDSEKARAQFEKVIRIAPGQPEAAEARDQIRKLQKPS